MAAYKSIYVSANGSPGSKEVLHSFLTNSFSIVPIVRTVRIEDIPRIFHIEVAILGVQKVPTT